MIATLPHDKPRKAMRIVHLLIAITLILTFFILKLGVDERRKSKIADEFESRRSLIMSRIDNAVDRQDLATLTRINSKYSNCVSDGTFQSAIREALAKVTAHEAQLELEVSRHLDLLRHQEESQINYDPRKNQVPVDRKLQDQPLSKLPR